MGLKEVGISFLGWAEIRALVAQIFLLLIFPFLIFNIYSHWLLFVPWLFFTCYIARTFAAGVPYNAKGSVKQDLSNQVYIVTGAAQGGIGFETSAELAKLGATVFVCVRTKQRAEECAKQICERVGLQGNQQNLIKHIELDLSNLQSVKNAAKEILKKTDRIDGLCNNAGIMMCPFGETTDGLEMQMGTNHFGHFYLTQLLLPTILKTKGGRIVNVSSAGHCIFVNQRIEWEKMSKKETYDPTISYGNSKLANVYHMKELHRKYQATNPDFRAISLHPGAVLTNLSRHFPGIFQKLQKIGKLYLLTLMKTPVEGSQTSLFCLLNENAKSGSHYSDCQENESTISNLEKEAKEWYEKTVEILKEKTANLQ